MERNSKNGAKNASKSTISDDLRNGKKSSVFLRTYAASATHVRKFGYVRAQILLPTHADFPACAPKFPLALPLYTLLYILTKDRENMKFKLIPKRNPQDRESAPKYYAQPEYNGMIDVDFIAKQIAGRSSLTAGDIKSYSAISSKKCPPLCCWVIR